MKIISVIGARPQFIKAAVVSRSIMKYPDELNEIIIHTGQHFDDNMSKIFFEEMEIPNPVYNLGIHGKSHGAMTGEMLEGIEKILMNEKPDLVMVYGDTNSTLAGALAARKLNIRLAHVEAGLRSFNNKMPEETNRILTDRISDFLFCPTKTSVANLEREGFRLFGNKILNTGDVMQDAAMYYSQKSSLKSHIISDMKLSYFILCTLHRAENTDDLKRLQSIVDALNSISKMINIILPLHPRTKKILETNKISLDFKTIDPVGYFDVIELLKHCRLVMTDSGGMQKEAFFFKKHCVTLRDDTEWIELVEKGFNILSGADTDKIKQSFETMISKTSDFSEDLYGGGKASERIVDCFLNIR